MMHWELARGAKVLVEYVCNLREGENVLIYTDTSGDLLAASYLAAAAYAAGGVVSLLVYETPPRVDMEPPPPLAAAMTRADLLIELAEKYLIHTRAYLEALKSARILCLTGMTCEMMHRCVSHVNYPKMLEFGERLTNLLKQGHTLEIRTAAGTDLVCELGGRVEHNAGRIFKAGQETYLGGQVSCYPVKDSINGIIVFDGVVWPPEDLGVLREPIILKIRKGEIEKIEGGHAAARLRLWLKSFEDPNMFMIAHISFGFNPGARLTGKILEDERVFGCVEVGIGSQVPSFEVGLASAHTDGVVLTPTIKLNNAVIEEAGRFVHPELKEIAEALIKNIP